jgi:hypothetical protein
MSVYNALRTDSQRDAISKILQNQRIHETNPYASWDIIFIKPNRAPVTGTFGRATETKSIRVILKRQPRTDPNVALSPLAKFGGVVDTTQQLYMPPMQSQQNVVQPQMNQGMNQGINQGMNPGMNHGMNHGMNNQSGPAPTRDLPPPPPRMPQQNMNQHTNGQNNNNTQKVDPPRTQPGVGQKNSGPLNKQTMVNPTRQSMNSLEKIENWRVQANSDSMDDSESGDSAMFAMDGMRNNTKNVKALKIPVPPVGRPLASGAIPKNGSPKSPDPILRRKTSTRDVRTTPRGDEQRVERQVTEDFRRPKSGSSSDESWDKFDEYSRKSYSTRGTVYSSGSSEDRRYRRSDSKDRKDLRDRKARRRSHSREPHRSRSRDPRRTSRHSSYREHRKPSPYRGLSPARSSDRERDTKPLVVHIHNSDSNVLTHQRQIPSPPASSTASVFGNSYPVQQRALQYPEDDVFNVSPLQTTLPRVPMVPDYTRQDRTIMRQEKAAEEYMRTQERRNSTAQVVDAFERGIKAGRRDDDDIRFNTELERHRRDKAQEQHLEDLRMQKRVMYAQWKHDDEVERMRRDRERDYVPAAYGASLRDSTYSRKVPSYLDGASRRDSSYLGGPSQRDHSYLGGPSRRDSSYLDGASRTDFSHLDSRYDDSRRFSMRGTKEPFYSALI